MMTTQSPLCLEKELRPQEKGIPLRHQAALPPCVLGSNPSGRPFNKGKRWPPFLGSSLRSCSPKRGRTTVSPNTAAPGPNGCVPAGRAPSGRGGRGDARLRGWPPSCGQFQERANCPRAGADRLGWVCLWGPPRASPGHPSLARPPDLGGPDDGTGTTPPCKTQNKSNLPWRRRDSPSAAGGAQSWGSLGWRAGFGFGFLFPLSWRPPLHPTPRFCGLGPSGGEPGPGTAAVRMPPGVLQLLKPSWRAARGFPGGSAGIFPGAVSCATILLYALISLALFSLRHACFSSCHLSRASSQVLRAQDGRLTVPAKKELTTLSTLCSDSSARHLLGHRVSIYIASESKRA